MTPSLRDLQRRFARALREDADARIGVYRSNVVASYRNALAATYPVVKALTGTPFFDAAVDAFTQVHPPSGGDLNVYGGELASFLAAYPHARDLPYLPDVARLEWAIDECARAADAVGTPAGLLTRLAAATGDDVASLRFLLDPSCRLIESRYPVMRIWQAHQPGQDLAVDLSQGPDDLLVRREDGVPLVERVAHAELAWLSAVRDGANLAGALERAVAMDPAFDLGAALGRRIADRTLAEVREPG